MAAEEHFENGSGKISYTIRELLAEIKASLANIDQKLDSKAEKSVVDNLVVRLSAIETSRTAEREYGLQLFDQWKELVKDHAQVKLDINSLQTNKKDKETFNFLWIPTIASLVGVVLLAFFK